MYTFVHNEALSENPAETFVQQAEKQPAIPLILELCEALNTKQVKYCHWKSNNALDRTANGDNDLDLLVDRLDASQLIEILGRLGFKQTKAPPEKQMQSVVDFHGYDFTSDKFVHVHVHYQLMLGHDMTKNFRLPIEMPYLASATQNGIFKVPAPEYEYIVFVIRMILKHSTWDAMLGREGSLKASERREFLYLQTYIDPNKVAALLEEHLPWIEPTLFANCVAALQAKLSFSQRARIAHTLQVRLQTYAQRSLLVDTTIKLLRRVAIALRWRFLKSPTKYKPLNGGMVIALMGGDGAGKSTAVDALYEWLKQTFETKRVHMGKPAWSLTTRLIRCGLKVGQVIGLYPTETSMEETLRQRSLVAPGYPWMIREVCIARDRFRTYMRGQRLAANGSIIIFDRFPHERIEIMDGPRTKQFLNSLNHGAMLAGAFRPQYGKALSEKLVALEQKYYQQIAQPEVLAILIVHPDIAVQRKTTEKPEHVRQRSTAIWNTDWNGSGIHVIDASKSKEEVLAELKALVWSHL